MRLLLSVLIRVKAAAWRFNQLDNSVLPRKALYWPYLVPREILQACYAPLQKLKIKQKSKLMPGSEINFVVRARAADFKVRGPVTTSFELGRGGERQIWLFSLCGCLELSDCWTFLDSLSSGVMFINFRRLKSTFSCWAWLHTQDPPVEVCRSWYYTIGSCNPFILSSISSKCTRDHIIRRYNSF